MENNLGYYSRFKEPVESQNVVFSQHINSKKHQCSLLK